MNIEEINSYGDIDTYYEAEIPRFIQEILEDRVEALKHCVNYKKEIENLHSIIKEVREFIEWHYEDNKKFYKNKGIGLNYPECDYILEILDKVGDGK